MNLQDTRNLISFHYWARNRMLDAVELIPVEQFTKEAGGSFGSVRNTMVHTLSAERIWLSRWKAETPPGPLSPEDFPNTGSLRSAWSDQEAKLRAYFEGLDEAQIQRVIPYKTLAGQDSSAVLWQMLQHVVNHASYHRGQVTTMLRQFGAAPPKATDMIVFYRENP
jgi:uncharacterized damage-inducible protein DinB